MSKPILTQLKIHLPRCWYMVSSERSFSTDPRWFRPRILRKISFLRNHLSTTWKANFHLSQKAPSWLTYSLKLPDMPPTTGYTSRNNNYNWLLKFWWPIGKSGVCPSSTIWIGRLKTHTYTHTWIFALPFYCFMTNTSSEEDPFNPFE